MNQEVILIAEDNEVLRTALEEMLALEGFVVLTAGNGIQALEHMNVISPDLIVSDIAMPEMDGYTFFQTVRSRPEWLSIPFIFLTARGTKDDILVGKDLGAEDYLVKPLNTERFLAKVKQILRTDEQAEDQT